MNSSTNETVATEVILKAARSAYCWGKQTDAARLYREAAGRHQENKRIGEEMDARRWLGNSLMWSGEHNEALKLLMEVASCGRADVEPDSVYGAKTDCIMLLLHHAPAATCRALIDETHTWLERIGKPQWRHRLDLLGSILLFRQGKHPAAVAAAMQAHRLVHAAVDGPRYVETAYFKWITRSLFYGRQEISLLEYAQRAEAQFVVMHSDRMRLSCIRLLNARLRRTGERDAIGVAEEARAAADVVCQLDRTCDEVFEIGCALMLAGDWNTLDNLPVEQITVFPFERAKFAADREINLLRRNLKLPMWDAELNWPPELPATLPSAASINSSDLDKLESALSNLATAAQLEDQRLETTICSEAAQLRTRHAQALLRASGLELQINPLRHFPPNLQISNG